MNEPVQLEFQFTFPVSKRDFYGRLYGRLPRREYEFLKAFNDLFLTEMQPIWPDRDSHSGAVTGRLTATEVREREARWFRPRQISQRQREQIRRAAVNATIYGAGPAMIIADDVHIVDIESRPVDWSALEIRAHTWNSPRSNTSQHSSRSPSSSGSGGLAGEAMVRAEGLEPPRSHGRT